MPHVSNSALAEDAAPPPASPDVGHGLPPPIRHAPKWPWMVGALFLILAVTAGAIASNAARGSGSEHKQTVGCTAPAFENVLRASPVIDAGSKQATSVIKFKCEQGYAWAQLAGSSTGTEAFFEEQSDGTWKLLDTGNHLGDGSTAGLPQGLAGRLRS